MGFSEQRTECCLSNSELHGVFRKCHSRPPSQDVFWLLLWFGFFFDNEEEMNYGFIHYLYYTKNGDGLFALPIPVF